MNRPTPGMIVRRKSDEAEGVVITDPFRCCTENEVPVVYFGTTTFLGTDVSELTIVGKEDATPDPERCGVGRGSDCCIFLTMGAGGFNCQRFGSLRNTLIFKDMHAKRHPAEAFPDCMSIQPKAKP